MNARALCYHYSHMARGNAREYLFSDKVRLKKYFYVLRPLFAIRYIEQDRGIPPVPFEDLVEAVAPDYLREAIARLLSLKRNTGELGLGDPVPEINELRSDSVFPMTPDTSRLPGPGVNPGVVER